VSSAGALPRAHGARPAAQRPQRRPAGRNESTSAQVVAVARVCSRGTRWSVKTGHAAHVAGIAVAFACWGLAGGCGGRSVLDETGADTGGSGSGGSSRGSSASSSGTGSGSGSGPIVDASMPDAGCDAQRLAAEVCQLLSPTSDPDPTSEAFVFDRHVDFLDFFRQRALTSDPALCGGGTTVPRPRQSERPASLARSGANTRSDALRAGSTGLSCSRSGGSPRRRPNNPRCSTDCRCCRHRCPATR